MPLKQYLISLAWPACWHCSSKPAEEFENALNTSNSAQVWAIAHSLLLDRVFG